MNNLSLEQLQELLKNAINKQLSKEFIMLITEEIDNR